MTIPAGLRVWPVHDLRSRRGVGEGLNSVWGGRAMGNSGAGVGVLSACAGLERPEADFRGVDVPDLRALLYSIMRKILFGSLLDVMMVVTPAAVAISAAMSFVSIPPVPKFEPRVVVLTFAI